MLEEEISPAGEFTGILLQPENKITGSIKNTNKEIYFW
jgi:hypothetical protein